MADKYFNDVNADQHTPLPWRWDQEARAIVGANGATVISTGKTTDEAIEKAKADPRTLGERAANVRLLIRSINAAPDLLAALESVAECLDGDGMPASQERELQALDRARNAIAKAKAKGEE